MQTAVNSHPLLDALTTIGQLDLDPIKLKLMDPDEGHGWSRSYADSMEIAYKRYLTLLVKYPDEPVAPTKDIDKFWHAHILDTLKYAEDCQSIFGKFLHHFPYFGMRGTQDRLNLSQASDAMATLYAKEFGEPLPRSAGWCIKADVARVDSAWCIKSTASTHGTAWCIKADAAWCIKAESRKSDAAWCIKAGMSKPDAAWCIKAEVTNADTAWCIKASASKTDAAWCIKAETPQVDAAWCIKAEAPQKPDASWCIKAVAPGADAAWCIKAESHRLDAAWCIKSADRSRSPDTSKRPTLPTVA